MSGTRDENGDEFEAELESEDDDSEDEHHSTSLEAAAAARDSSLKAVFELNTTCAVCYNRFVSPKVLPCQHTFCLDCLQNCVQPGIENKIGCPTCRRGYILRGDGVASLPSNIVIQNFIDALGSDTRYCPDPSHDDSFQSLTCFCIHCNAETCAVCAETVHKDHLCNLKPQVQRAFIKTISSLETKAKKALSGLRRDQNETVNQEKAKVDAEAQKIEEKIRQAAEEAKQDVDKSREILLRELDQLKARAIEPVDNFSNGLSQSIQGIERFKATAARAKQKTDLRDLSQTVTQLTNVDLQQLSQVENESVPAFLFEKSQRMSMAVGIGSVKIVDRNSRVLKREFEGNRTNSSSSASQPKIPRNGRSSSGRQIEVPPNCP